MCRATVFCARCTTSSSLWHQDSKQTAEAADRTRVHDVLRRCSILGLERERAAFDARTLEQDLGRLLQGGNVEQHRPVLDLPLARSALAGAGAKPY